MACILLWSSAVRVHDSQAYRKMDVTRERISRILQLRKILLSLQTGVNLVSAAVVCAILVEPMDNTALSYTIRRPMEIPAESCLLQKVNDIVLCFLLYVYC